MGYSDNMKGHASQICFCSFCNALCYHLYKTVWVFDKHWRIALRSLSSWWMGKSHYRRKLLVLFSFQISPYCTLYPDAFDFRPGASVLWSHTRGVIVNLDFPRFLALAGNLVVCSWWMLYVLYAHVLWLVISMNVKMCTCMCVFHVPVSICFLAVCVCLFISQVLPEINLCKPA